MKRKDYLNWDEYFMSIAILSGQRSKDPNSQVGCCIVGEDNKIASVGYNGMPFGCNDDDFSWDRKAESWVDTKYPYVCHSELNAILNYRGGSLKNHKIYVTLFPCNECAKAIIQCGIKEIIYADDKYAKEENVIASKKMLKAASIKTVLYKKTGRKIEIEV